MVTDRRGTLTAVCWNYLCIFVCVFAKCCSVVCDRKRANPTYLSGTQKNIHTPKKKEKEKKKLVHSNTGCSLVVTLILNKEKQRTRSSREVLTLETSVGMEQNHKGKEGKLITEEWEKVE